MIDYFRKLPGNGIVSKCRINGVPGPWDGVVGIVAFEESLNLDEFVVIVSDPEGPLGKNAEGGEINQSDQQYGTKSGMGGMEVSDEYSHSRYYGLNDPP